jgi:acetamidase/formamidase
LLLQSGEGPIDGEHYVTSEPDTVSWGYLPNRGAKPILRVKSGASVTFDTISHEGILEDQGRDPQAWFGRHGVGPDAILRDAIDLAGSRVPHHFDEGPHVVTAPVHVEGAMPGDVLQVDVLALDLRAPYGVVSNRHGKGCLAGEFPEHTLRLPDASVSFPDRFGSIHTFFTAEQGPLGPMGVLPFAAGRVARFALRPFLGIMGVAADTDAPVSSVPPGRYGGNLDISLLVKGSTLYLPIQVEGALFYVGDPHFSQGNGEVALTALEAPLRATLRLSRIPADEAVGAIGRIDRPFVENDDYWVPIGLDPDLDEAMRQATRAAISLLETKVGMARADALAYLSATSDFEISQVVDGVKGIHCRIRKADFD